MATSKRGTSDFSKASNQSARDSTLSSATSARDTLGTGDTSAPASRARSSSRRTTTGSRDIDDTSDVSIGTNEYRRDLNDDRAQAASDYWDDDSGPGPQVMAADTLTGEKVVNAEGETLGDIEDIMLDVPTGRIAYAVLSVGGFLGLGDKLFAIPWRALELDTENKCFVLNVDKEKLENAPGFDKDHWPSMADESWANEVHSYYGSQPYWE